MLLSNISNPKKWYTLGDSGIVIKHWKNVKEIDNILHLCSMNSTKVP